VLKLLFAWKARHSCYVNLISYWSGLVHGVGLFMGLACSWGWLVHGVVWKLWYRYEGVSMNLFFEVMRCLMLHV